MSSTTNATVADTPYADDDERVITSMLQNVGIHGSVDDLPSEYRTGAQAFRVKDSGAHVTAVTEPFYGVVEGELVFSFSTYLRGTVYRNPEGRIFCVSDGRSLVFTIGENLYFRRAGASRPWQYIIVDHVANDQISISLARWPIEDGFEENLWLSGMCLALRLRDFTERIPFTYCLAIVGDPSNRWTATHNGPLGEEQVSHIIGTTEARTMKLLFSDGTSRVTCVKLSAEHEELDEANPYQTIWYEDERMVQSYDNFGVITEYKGELGDEYIDKRIHPDGVIEVWNRYGNYIERKMFLTGCYDDFDGDGNMTKSKFNVPKTVYDKDGNEWIKTRRTTSVFWKAGDRPGEESVERMENTFRNGSKRIIIFRGERYHERKVMEIVDIYGTKLFRGDRGRERMVRFMDKNGKDVGDRVGGYPEEMGFSQQEAERVADELLEEESVMRTANHKGKKRRRNKKKMKKTEVRSLQDDTLSSHARRSPSREDINRVGEDEEEDMHAARLFAKQPTDHNGHDVDRDDDHREENEEGDPDNLNENNECVICMEREKSHVFVPCGHLCVCLECSGGMTHCPMCCGSAVMVVRVYA